MNSPHGLECLSLPLASLSNELLPLLATLCLVPDSSPQTCCKHLPPLTRGIAWTRLPRHHSCLLLPMQEVTEDPNKHNPLLTPAPWPGPASFPCSSFKTAHLASSKRPPPTRPMPGTPCPQLTSPAAHSPCVLEGLPHFRAHTFFPRYLVSFLGIETIRA